MGSLLTLLLLAGTGLLALFRPWVGVVGAYVLGVLAPQYIWFWSFEGLRPVLVVVIPTLLGFFAALVTGRLSLAPLARPRNLLMALLFVAYSGSYLFGPYTHVTSGLRSADPAWAYGIAVNMFILYVVGTTCITTTRRLVALGAVLVVTGVYLTYWANATYLATRPWSRLQGPADASGVGIYRDANVFAMVFVCAVPFLWYFALGLKRALPRYALWAVIPFAWHAVFLTGSRGGLLGLVVVTLVVALRSRKKWLGLMLIPAFIAAYQLQAGEVMKERTETLDDFQTESSAAGRLSAWQAAGRMIAAHPVTGVGVASFVTAFPDFSGDKSREAHNTFLQIAAESGVLAGAAYLAFTVSIVLALWRTSRIIDRAGGAERNWPLLVTEATLAAVIGLTVCGLFLSLQLFEMYYYLAVMANGSLHAAAIRPPPVSIPRAPLVPFARTPVAGNRTAPRPPVVFPPIQQGNTRHDR